MQKKLIALAIAGLSSAAFAQSNVTISGQMKVSFEGVSANGATANNADLTSRHRVVDDNSNLRFSGEEALGNGTSAWFQIESAVGTNDNVGTTGGLYGTTNSTTIGARNTAVGLKGNWGTALMGKWDVHYNAMVPVEAAGLADGLALATSSLNLTQRINGTTVAGSGRDNNVIAYVTPSWNGLSALIGYTTVGQSTANRLGAKDSGWTFNPKYVNGPIAVSYSYLGVKNAGATAPAAGAIACANPLTGAVTVTSAAACAAAGGTNIAAVAAVAAGTSGAKVTSNKLGGAYTFPMGLKIGAIWDKSKVTQNQVTGAEIHRTTWALPISYKTGVHTVSFTWAKAKDADGSNGAGGQNAAGGTNTGARMWMLGYQYDMSKRTSVGLSYTAINNDARATYDYWHPSSSVSGGATVPAGSDPRKFSMTVRHTF